MNPVFTIGHSNQTLDAFIALLHSHGITALADVRSQPYSRHVPHFSREPLKAALEEAGISYVFLGKELGARPQDADCYEDGKVSYAKLAQRPAFAEGISRLISGSNRHRIALMCAEKDPAHCHRGLLVSPALLQQGVAVLHIHGDGHLENHASLQARLPQNEKGPTPDLFR